MPKRPLRCPICKGPVEGGTEKSSFPFCSERCQRVDLGNWLGEGYRVQEPGEAIGSEAYEGEEER